MNLRDLLEKLVSVCGFDIAQKEEILEDLEDEVLSTFASSFAEKEKTQLVQDFESALAENDPEKIQPLLEQLMQQPDIQEQFKTTIQEVLSDWLATITESMDAAQREAVTRELSALDTQI